MIVLTESSREKVLLAALVDPPRGNREAFGELVERFQRSVYALALRRLRTMPKPRSWTRRGLRPGHAEDRATARAGMLRRLARSITTRMAINRSLRSGPVVPIERETLEATCVERHTPLAAALDREQASQVTAGLGRLRTMDRKTLEAFYVRGQSLVEMSTEFGSPIGTIKRRLHVSRKRLAHELEELAPA